MVVHAGSRAIGIEQRRSKQVALPCEVRVLIPRWDLVPKPFCTPANLAVHRLRLPP